MSHKTIVSLIVLYFVAALAATAFLRLGQPYSTGDEVLTEAFGAAFRLYVVSAVIPAIVWAFSKFRVERAVVPFVLWAVIGVAYAFAVYKSVPL